MVNVMLNIKKRLAITPAKIAVLLCLMAFFTGLYILTNTSTFSKWCYEYLWLDKESRTLVRESDRITFNYVHARMSSTEYTLLINGDFEIPDGTKIIKKREELKPLLDSTDTLTYSAAIRRLGEIEGPKAINTLKGYLSKETTPFDVASISVKKLEAIRTLGRIGTEQAKTILLDQLKLYWEKGPIQSEISNIHISYAPDNKDFTYTVSELLKAIYKWSSDDKVYEYAKKVAESTDVNNFYSTSDGISQRAWAISLKGEMLRKGIVKEKDSAMYLMDYTQNIINSGIDLSGTVKVMAAADILERFSNETLSSVVSDYEGQLKKEPDGPRNNPITERQHNLISKISRLKSLMKNMNEKKAKLDAYKHQFHEIQFTPID
jgi:hypothetical protein